MDEQKAAVERLKALQGQGLNELKASVANHLDRLAGQWNDEIRKVTEQ